MSYDTIGAPSRDPGGGRKELLRMYAFVYHRINGDMRAAADYRAELVTVLARRAVAAALEEAPE